MVLKYSWFFWEVVCRFALNLASSSILSINKFFKFFDGVAWATPGTHIRLSNWGLRFCSKRRVIIKGNRLLEKEMENYVKI